MTLVNVFLPAYSSDASHKLSCFEVEEDSLLTADASN